MKKPDCKTCGLCCVVLGAYQSAFCDVTLEDEKRLGKRFIRLNVLRSHPLDVLAAALDGAFHPQAAITTKTIVVKRGPLQGIELCKCSQLNGDPMNAVSCKIYEKRPETCKTSVTPGDKSCLGIRKLYKEYVDNAQKETRTGNVLHVLPKAAGKKRGARRREL